MFSFHILDDISKIVSMNIEMFLWACKRQAPGCIRRKVTEIPAFNKFTECGNTRMLFERSQGGDTQFASVIKLNQFCFSRFFLLGV